MNREAVIRHFIKNNLNLLTSTEFNKKAYKERLTSCFVQKHKNKLGRPTNKEVMVELINYLKSHGITDTEIINKIDTLPFFKDASETIKEELYGLLEGNKFDSDLNKEQLEIIKKVNAFEAVELIKGKEIEERKQQELLEIKKQIEIKRSEYDALPSILDAEEIKEPEFSPEIEDIKPWWERFYLKSDPFPQKDGLSSIAKELYEQIIYKTKPFNDALSNLQRNANFFFHKGTLLVGDYGYGKTTFIHYLSYFLINHDIIPILITCGHKFSDSSGYTDSFYLGLKKECLEEAEKMTPIDKADLREMELEDQVIELASKISARKKGIIVFVDDYHKHREHFPPIFEFLGTLQILKNKLTRKNINVGFIVSGIPSWKDELLHNRHLSGFLDNTTIEMPDITAEHVCEVFNRRIKAFCYESTPRLIKADFVQRLVKELDGKAGFRDYLTKIITELSNNNQAIVDSPIEIVEGTLSEIKLIIEADPALKSSLNKLLYESKFKRFSQEQIAKCLELLVHVGMQNGIAEDDRQFIDNKFYFTVLRDSILIQKQRSTKRAVCEWGLHNRLRKVTSLILDKYRLNLHDYLLKIYAYKEYSSQLMSNQTEEANELSDLKRFLNQQKPLLSKSIYDHINLGLRLYDSVLLSENNSTNDRPCLDRAYNALQALSLALFELDTSYLYFHKLNIKDLNEQWLLHPFNEESIEEAFIRFADYQAEPTDQHWLLALKQIKNVLQLVSTHVLTIVKDKCGYTDFALLSRTLMHTNDEINLFREIRNLSYSARGEDHFTYVRKLTDHLELKFRSFLYFTSFLLFGERYFEQCPKTLLSYAHKNLDYHPSYVVERNMFDGLTRSQFKQIFINNNGIKEHIIKYLGLTWKEADWGTFCNEFSIENIKTVHQHIDAFSQTERNKYLRYCVLAEELLASINKLIAEYLQHHVFVCIVSAEHDYSHGDCLFRNSIRPPEIETTEGKESQKVFRNWPKSLETKEDIFDHLPADTEIFNRILTSIKLKLESSPSGILIQDLLDIEYITTHYRATIADFIHSLSYCKLVSKDLIVEPWFGSSVAIAFPKYPTIKYSR